MCFNSPQPSLGVFPHSQFDWQPRGSGSITIVISLHHMPNSTGSHQSRLLRLLTSNLWGSLVKGINKQTGVVRDLCEGEAEIVAVVKSLVVYDVI